MQNVATRLSGGGIQPAPRVSPFSLPGLSGLSGALGVLGAFSATRSAVVLLASASRSPVAYSFLLCVPGQLQALTERLHKINEAIAQKIAARDDYDKTVRETESAYMKVPPPYPRCCRLHLFLLLACVSCLGAGIKCVWPCLVSHRAVCRVLSCGPTDFGKFANPPHGAQARVRQPHKETTVLGRYVVCPD